VSRTLFALAPGLDRCAAAIVAAVHAMAATSTSSMRMGT
jgi:hypothetical protein